jgi:hypothetical protein
MTSNSSPDNLEPDADDPLDEGDDFVEAVFIPSRKRNDVDRAGQYP